MAAYDPEIIREEIKKILDVEYEHMYPFEIEKALGELGKQAKENNDKMNMKRIRWEYDLLNVTIGHVAELNGKTIHEISNKWETILLNKKDIDTKREVSVSEIGFEPEGKTIYLKPLSNLPFCEWQEEALDYYKQRYENTTSELSKARYAFVIMVFSKGKERLEWMKKSTEGWLKTAEKYVDNKKYSKFYEVPSFAYEFALKLSLSFGDKELAKAVLQSLHSSILKILGDGEKRWHLEFFEVESMYIVEFDDTKGMINESVKKIKAIIDELEKSFKQSGDKQKSNHFLRHHIKILINYKTEDEYNLNKMVADSYISEAEFREEPLVKSAFYNDAIKKYKLMESQFSNKKEEINKKIEELILKIKEINSKIEYKTVRTQFTIKKEQINSYIDKLKKINDNVFEALLIDNSLFPKYSTVKTQTESLKKQYPLQFIMPIIVYNKEEPIMKHVQEEQIFDYQLRRNILLGLKMSELVIKMTLETLEKELKIKNFEKVDELLKIGELKDIYPTLQKGFYYIFGDKKDYIAGVHIIVPYFEEIIRRIINKVGKVNVILQSHDTKYFRGIELGTLVVDEEVGKLIGINFQKSLKVLLVDNDQTNLRNELLHGRLESEKIKESDIVFVAYCLLKLIKILKDIK